MKRMNLVAVLTAVSTLALAATMLRPSVTPPVAATPRDGADAQTLRAIGAAQAFISTLDVDQEKVAHLDFTPQKVAGEARFPHIGGPKGAGPAGGAGGPPHGPGGNGDPPMGKSGALGGAGAGGMPDFVGERYGQAVWSNYPVSDVPRPGLRLGELTAAQRAAAMRLLQTLLSPNGYQKILEIMGSDQALSNQGQPFASGRDVYTIAIFGNPSTTTPWMVEFGGHHLGVNVVIAGLHGVVTPMLTGAQPAIYTGNGKKVRALAAENDKAFALLNALSADQRKQAILNYQIGDLVMGPGHAGEMIVPEGLKVSSMTARQKGMLLDVISEWAGVIDPVYAKPRMAEIAAGLNDTWFAWSGPTTHQPGRNGSAYYRIQGPKLLIEFSPQGVGGDATMHVHTMYRDPTNDYGAAYTLR